MRTPVSVCLCVLVWSAALSSTSRGADVWSGLTKTFTKIGGADPTLPQNQDEITQNVVLSRGNSGGLINVAWEVGYSSGISPEFTEWATDLTSPGETIEASNWASLTFDSWISAFGGSLSMGTNIVGRDAVLHFDDVYLDLRFTSWEVGQGGGFTYMRAEPPAPPPTGDYSGNNVVDAADYTVWRDTLGSTTDLRANGDNTEQSEGKIDDADYVFWKAHFGDMVPLGAGGGQVATVPEPTMLVLVLIGLTSLLTIRISPRARASCRATTLHGDV